ncbi:acyltransferase family protein [Cellvibrio sp. UBA7661]|uniref:acyltransferase family protein n=1 Tax=Cellvibrio sp. UBA7661 TaxID=1946311 RepID=UPI002F355BCA
MPEKLPTTRLTPDVTHRLHELDGLRVTVFGLLILYHTGMLYVADWGWHYKSQYQSEALANVMLWSNQWRMSLLFFISGAALALFLPRNRDNSFSRAPGISRALGKRLGYLLLPLFFGMLVVVVPQVYIEAKSQHIMEELNYWQFWYAYLDQQSAKFEQHKTLGSMHLTWNHLWYLPYLIVYTLIMAMLYPLLISKAMQPVWRWFSARITLTTIVLLPIAGFYLNGALLYTNNPVTHNLVEDWFNHGRSFLSFVLGFALVQIPALWQSIKTIRWHLLIIGLLNYSYTLFAFHGGKLVSGMLGEGFIAQEVNGLLWSANSWLWILCVTAWGQHWFNKRSPLIRYLNSGIFCFYILHQTLIIVFAYWLAPLTLGGLFEPIAVITLVIAGCWILFEILKKIPGLRIVFGINPHAPHKPG